MIITKQADNVTGAGLLTTQWQDGRPLYGSQDYWRMIEANTKWVYRCVQVIADACSSVPFRLYVVQPENAKQLLHAHRKLSRNETDKAFAASPRIAKALRSITRGDLVEIIDHPLISLLATVNPHTNGTELQKLKWTFERITGNAYWLKERNGMGVIEKLWTLPVPRVSIIPSSETFIKGYEYRKDTGQVFLDESEVIHFKDPSPSCQYYGMAPLAAAVDSVTMQKYMDKFNIDLFSNKAMPETVLTTDQKLNKSIVDRIVEGWKERFSSNRGMTGGEGPAILDSGLTPHTLTMTPQELNYGEGAIQVRNEIYTIYGVPITKAEVSEVRANTASGDAQFQKDTVLPLLRRDEEKLNEKLVAEFDPRLIGLYDDPVDADKEFALKKQVEQVKTKIITIDEARAEEGKEPLTDEERALMQPQPIAVDTDAPIDEPDISDDDKAFANAMAKTAARYRVMGQ